MAKFFRRGISKIKWLPAVAGTSPTRAEITAGTDLSPQVSEINGYQLSNSPIVAPNLAEQFSPQIDGEDTVADSSLVFNDDDALTTIRTAMAKGTAGFLVFFPYGDVPTKRCEVWPCKSTGVNDEWNTGNNAARFAIGTSVTKTPTQNGITPA